MLFPNFERIKIIKPTERKPAISLSTYHIKKRTAQQQNNNKPAISFHTTVHKTTLLSSPRKSQEGRPDQHCVPPSSLLPPLPLSSPPRPQILNHPLFGGRRDGEGDRAASSAAAPWRRHHLPSPSRQPLQGQDRHCLHPLRRRPTAAACPPRHPIPPRAGGTPFSSLSQERRRRRPRRLASPLLPLDLPLFRGSPAAARRTLEGGGRPPAGGGTFLFAPALPKIWRPGPSRGGGCEIGLYFAEEEGEWQDGDACVSKFFHCASYRRQSFPRRVCLLLAYTRFLNRSEMH